MKNKTFEDYLTEKHGMQYAGLDDDMRDDYEDWLSRLDGQEYIDYAEEWGKKLTEK